MYYIGSKISHISHFSDSSGHRSFLYLMSLRLFTVSRKNELLWLAGFGHVPNLKVKRIGSITKRGNLLDKIVTITQTTKNLFSSIKYEDYLPSLPKIKEWHKTSAKPMGLYFGILCYQTFIDYFIWCVWYCWSLLMAGEVKFKEQRHWSQRGLGEKVVLPLVNRNNIMIIGHYPPGIMLYILYYFCLSTNP